LKPRRFCAHLAGRRAKRLPWASRSVYRRDERPAHAGNRLLCKPWGWVDTQTAVAGQRTAGGVPPLRLVRGRGPTVVIKPYSEELPCRSLPLTTRPITRTSGHSSPRQSREGSRCWRLPAACARRVPPPPRTAMLDIEVAYARRPLWPW